MFFGTVRFLNLITIIIIIDLYVLNTYFVSHANSVIHPSIQLSTPTHRFGYTDHAHNLLWSISKRLPTSGGSREGTREAQDPLILVKKEKPQKGESQQGK